MVKLAYLVCGGGCFWCLDALFRRVTGVIDVVSGYAGGSTTSPTYDSVCSGSTGHVEVVRIIYDPCLVSFESLVKIFFDVHNPTTLNRQDHDIGTQYRSYIQYKNDEERQVIEHVVDEYESEHNKKVTTQVVPEEIFYVAEDYHQNYYTKNPDQPYCIAVINPKLQKFLNKSG